MKADKRIIPVFPGIRLTGGGPVLNMHSQQFPLLWDLRYFPFAEWFDCSLFGQVSWVYSLNTSRLLLSFKQHRTQAIGRMRRFRFPQVSIQSLLIATMCNNDTLQYMYLYYIYIYVYLKKDAYLYSWIMQIIILFLCGILSAAGPLVFFFHSRYEEM